MFVFLSFFALLYLSTSNEEVLNGEQNVYHTPFPKIQSIENLFPKEPEYDETPAPTSKPNANGPDDEPDDKFDSLNQKFLDMFKVNQTDVSNHSFDILDFMVINEKHSNITKEYKKNIERIPDIIRFNQTRRLEYYDPDDTFFGEQVEELKRRRLMMVMVQFVMHCRYEVGKALLHRELVRHDWRYKLGYLFNRLRRLKTEQLKMVAAGWELLSSKYRHMYTLMRLYERVVHFDVDMRDTAALIRSVYE